MDRICVMMATYNGEKYIREQIDSILAQESVEVELLVRDDHSTDSTLQILREYAADGRLRILEDDVHLGAAGGFMKLLYNAGPCPWYAFADQDDVWLPDKLIRAIDAIRSFDVPALYCSNQILYRGGREEGLRFDKAPNYTLANSICGNSLSGCTMVMNRALRDEIADEGHRPSAGILSLRMHDVWVLLSALVLGEVVYDEWSGIRYRLHEANTVGIRPTGPAWRLKSLKKRLGSKKERNGRSRIARELLKYDIKDPAKKEVVESFARCGQSLPARLRLIKNRDVRRDCGEKRPLFIAKTLLGWI